ncbi:hypothetical protein WD019_15075 [Fictibacillus sp. Mic-4]
MKSNKIKVFLKAHEAGKIFLTSEGKALLIKLERRSKDGIKKGVARS